MLRWSTIERPIAIVVAIATVAGTYFTYKSYDLSQRSTPPQNAADNQNKTVSAKQASASDAVTLRASPERGIRALFQTVTMVGKEVQVGTQSWYTATASFEIRNQGDRGFEAALRQGGTSVGPCVGNEQQSSGLSFVRNPSNTSSLLTPEGPLQYLAPGSTVHVTILLGCSGQFSRDTTITISLLARINNESLNIPLSAAGVPVQLGGFR